MFRDRFEAAAELAGSLQAYRGRKDAVVLAIPRGGVAIGAVLSSELGLPLDVVLTKKIGHPMSPEYAIGFVSLTGHAVDESIVGREEIRRSYVEAEIKRLRALLRERNRVYRGGAEPLSLKGKTALIVDDGIATGSTVRGAILEARRGGAARVVVCAPVAAPASLEELGSLADEVVCLEAPEGFTSIGEHYRDFEPVEDEEAVRLLSNAMSAMTGR